MLPQKKIKNLIDRHLKLEQELSSGVIDKNKYAEISKEYSDLNEIIKYVKDYLNFEKETKDLNNIINDKNSCLLYTSPSPRDVGISRMPSSA